jgi:hypothetical protein
MKSAPALFWHTAPLHYIPHLLATGCLYSQDELRRRGLPIRPRPTAERRDRKLRLSRFVHLSFAPQTPLLADKRAKGYPHGLLAFDASLAALPEAAFVPYNAKSWRHRDDFVPVCESGAKAALIEAWCGGRYPSAELLIETSLPFSPYGVSLHLASREEASWLCGLMEDLAMKVPLPVQVSPEIFPEGEMPDLAPHRSYAEECRATGRLLSPPDLPFD